MTAMKDRKTKSTAELRRFGLLMAVPLAIIGALLLWKGRFLGPYVTVLAALFLVTGVAAPILLRPVERIWMSFARVISVVMTHILLTLTFFVVITPVGIILRLLGKDVLQRRFEAGKPSYWAPVEPDGPCSRPEKPY